MPGDQAGHRLRLIRKGANGAFFLVRQAWREAPFIGAVSVHVVVAERLGGESPLPTRQGERLAEGKGVHREVESEGSLRM